MKNVVMGTAGHIDHGKTTLVKKLTGIDTDRLSEEKRRGITIELGFAPLILPSGNEISIVDVPGHEKFIKTMVAGASGIDFVMFVIAADEGVMQQTREHLAILSLLKVKYGVVALTKVDLVDNDWLNMVTDDIKKELKATFLEKSDIIPVSSNTGEGIDFLLEKLEELSSSAQRVEAQEFFRMPIDRVFTIQGHGTVITGTSHGGTINKGDTINILPSGISTKIREIQVHNKKIETAYPGQRVALNISGIEKSEIERGEVATKETWIKPITIADVVLNTSKGDFEIVNNQRVHVNIGTKELLARIKLIGMDKMDSEDKAYAQLKFEEEVVALKGDRFIIRAFSPVVTLGGGVILSHVNKNRGRFKEETLEELKLAEVGSMRAQINYLMKTSISPLKMEEIWRILLGEKSEVLKCLTEGVALNEFILLKSNNKYISKQLFNEYSTRIKKEFEDLKKKYPFRFEIDKEEIRSKVFNNLDIKDCTDLLINYIESNIFLMENNKVRENKIFKNIIEKKETKIIEHTIFQNGLNIKTKEQIKKELDNQGNKYLINNYEEIEKFLIRIGVIVNLGNDLLIHQEILKKTVKKIKEIFKAQEFITAINIRDNLECSRKAAIAIIEYLDLIGITERHEDLRQPGVHYMDYFL